MERAPRHILRRIGNTVTHATGLPLGIQQYHIARVEGKSFRIQAGKFIQGVGKEFGFPLATSVADDPTNFRLITDPANGFLYHGYILDLFFTGILDSIGVIGLVDGKTNVVAVMAGLHLLRNITTQAAIEIKDGRNNRRQRRN